MAARNPRTKAVKSDASKVPAPKAVPAPPEQADLLRWIEGYHATHLIAFGQESGAFQRLAGAGDHGLNVAELAEHAGWFPDYARWFLEASFALGLVELASEAGVTPRSRYRLSEKAAALLTDEHSPYYLGDYARLATLVGQDAKRLPDLYRSGKTFPYALHGEEFLRSAVAATRALPAYFLTEILPRLPRLRKRLEEGAHVLDIGCGAGWTVVKLAEEFAKCRVVGIDSEPNAIEMAKSWIAMRQVTKRAEARLVRGEEIDYEAEFDVATFALVLHSIPPKQRGAALAHAHRALKRDGLLVVLDEAYPETPKEFRDPAAQLTVLSQWVEGTWGHRFGTRAEYRELLEQSGFRIVDEVSVGRYVTILASKA